MALQLQPAATDDDSGDDDTDGTTRLFDLQRVLREASLAWLQRYLGPPLGVTRCGYLLKRNPHGLWQARWFVLEAPEDSCELCYYRALLPPLLTVCARSLCLSSHFGWHASRPTMRVELIGHFKPCMPEIYLHIDARMADYIHTNPYAAKAGPPDLRLSSYMIYVWHACVEAK